MIARSYDPNDSLVVPLRSQAVLSQFPPSLLISGTRDFALSSVVYTHSQLVKLGVEGDLHIWEGLGHVPLSPLAIELLAQLKAITGEGVFVLPAYADKKKSASYSDRVLSRAVRENETHFGIPHRTPHDLRRTAASFMTSLKIPRLHVEKVLNHATGDIAEVYDRHDYLPEKRIALERWAAHLTEIIESRAPKVIPIRTGAGAA